MAEYHETFGEDVGSKLLLLASMLAVFGVVALILMPLGTAFAPPPNPPAATAPATPAADATPAAPTQPAAPAAVDAATPVPPAATPAAGLPPIIGALVPGILMLVAAAIIAVLAGLLLGHAKARAEAAGPPQAAPPH